MSTTDVQLRFAAEFALFLVSLGGLGYALLRPELLVTKPIARVAAALGFATLAGAAFLSGALVIDDPQDGFLLALRVGGIVFLAFASRWWQPAHGGRVLLWIGLLALAVADVAEQLGDDPGSVVYIARGIGAAAIGASLVVASTRAISARIAASAAVILFLVITALAVALSTVITDNVEAEAIRRYGTRAATEALAPNDEALAAGQSATVLGVALSGADDLATPLTQLTDPAAKPAATQAQATLVLQSIKQFQERLADTDPRFGPLVIVDSAKQPRAFPTDASPAVASLLAGNAVVAQALDSEQLAQGVAVVGSTPLAIAAAPITLTGADPRFRGVVVVTRQLDDSYLEARADPIAQEQPEAGLALVDHSSVLAEAGPSGPQDQMVELGVASLPSTGWAT